MLLLPTPLLYLTSCSWQLVDMARKGDSSDDESAESSDDDDDDDDDNDDDR